MPTREQLLALCGRDAPDPPEPPEPEHDVCGEISLEGSRFCVLDSGHDGPHAYEFHKLAVPVDTTGMVLHCANCHSQLTTKSSATHTGYWCDACCDWVATAAFDFGLGLAKYVSFNCPLRGVPERNFQDEHRSPKPVPSLVRK